MYRNYTTILEYIWLDGTGNRRSKTRIVKFDILKVDEIPIWNCDGSTTGQADSDGNTEVILVPSKYFINPLINDNAVNCNSFIVLCETFDINMVPLQSNHRTTNRPNMTSNLAGSHHKATQPNVNAANKTQNNCPEPFWLKVTCPRTSIWWRAAAVAMAEAACAWS